MLFGKAPQEAELFFVALQRLLRTMNDIVSGLPRNSDCFADLREGEIVEEMKFQTAPLLFCEQHAVHVEQFRQMKESFEHHSTRLPARHVSKTDTRRGISPD